MGLMISCSFLTVNWIHSDLINLIFKLLPRSFFVIWPDCTGWSNFPRTPVLVQWRRPCPQIIPQVNSNLDSDLCLSHTQDSSLLTPWGETPTDLQSGQWWVKWWWRKGQTSTIGWQWSVPRSEIMIYAQLLLGV